MGTTQSEIVKCVAGAGYKWNGRLRVVMASYSGADKARAMVEGFWLTNFNTNDPKVVAVVAVVAAVAAAVALVAAAVALVAAAVVAVAAAVVAVAVVVVVVLINRIS